MATPACPSSCNRPASPSMTATAAATSQYAEGGHAGKNLGKTAWASNHVTATMVSAKNRCRFSSIRW